MGGAAISNEGKLIDPRFLYLAVIKSSLSWYNYVFALIR